MSAIGPVTPADQDIRERLRTELGTTFFVEAGAGTGKTRELVERVVALVASGVAMERLAAITFTDAAAAELRGRVRLRLEEASVDPALSPEERDRCRQGALDIDLAAIQTIHSFAGGLLRLFPLEAGLPPGFAVQSELERDIAFKERFRRWLYDEVPADISRERAVRLGFALGLSANHLASLAARLQDHYDLLDPTATWQPDGLPDAVAAAGMVGDELLGLTSVLPLAHDADRDALAAEIRVVQPLARRLASASEAEEALANLKRLRDLNVAGRRGRQADWEGDIQGNPVARIRATFKTANDLADATLRAHRTNALGHLLACLRDFTLAFARERRADGVATFHDLLVWARDLLRDQPDVRRRAHARFERILIDEFQDTDPLQLEIAWLLAADPAQAEETDWRKLRPEPGRLFVVGDPKQSIYRFRRADVGIYEDVRAALGEGAEVLALSQSFRSVEPLLAWVNHHLGREMQPDPGVQPGYGQLQPRPQSPAGRCGAYRVGGPIEGKAGDRWLAEAKTVARLARQIVGQGWLVTRGDGLPPRPARFQDICVLLPTRGNLRRLERAFEREGVPYRMESGSLVLNTQEVRDLLSCLRAIEDPSDQVALVAALRSPAYACSDVDLLSWVEAGGRFDYEHPLAEEVAELSDGATRVQAALASLRAFHDARLGRSSAATIEAFIRDRLLAVQAFGQHRPRETWRRLRYVVAQARRLAASGQPSLRSAVDWLEGLQRESFYDAESVVPEGDEDAVRFMTVHGSKGLEFPIVILTGLGALRRRPAGPHIAGDRRQRRVEVYLNSLFASAGFDQQREDRLDQAEQLRLLYVAATRARDHLVLSLFHTEREGESHAGRILRGLAEAPELCHPVLLPEGELPVSEPVFELRPPAPSAGPAEHRLAEEAWVAGRELLVARLGSEPRFTATSLAHSLPAEDDHSAPEMALGGSEEPVRWFFGGRGATALGLAVHAVLQTIDLGSLAGLDRLGPAIAQRFGIAGRVEEVMALVRSAAASEPVQAALASGRFWREVPIGASHSGVLLEGFIDLLYQRPDGGLVVVDYKTDHITAPELEQRMAAYRVQGGAYAFALQQTLGRRVAAVEFLFAALGRVARFEDVEVLAAEVTRRLAASAPSAA